MSMTLYTDSLYGLTIAVNTVAGIKSIPHTTTKKRSCANAKTARIAILVSK